MTWRDALKVGFAQALSMIPGTSRSGATIIGGLFFGLSRRAATEFSFFLAIPTMFAATLYDVYKHRDLFSVDDIALFAVGGTVSFISAFLCRARIDTLYQPARFHRVCMVSHRLRHYCADLGTDGLGRLG
jgi:undecaprenyl pyrophosphate phosphatase UppP